MKSSDLPQAARERAFIHGLYAALGLQPHPMRVIWDMRLTPRQKRVLCNDARIPGVFFRVANRWDELTAAHREALTHAYRARVSA